MHLFSRKISILLGVVLCIAYFFVISDKWLVVQRSKGGRDYATFHYALQTSWDGDNPYKKNNLSKRAQQEHTRKRVHPFFYPPPSMLSMIWAKPFSLVSGYRVFFWLNQFLFFLSLWIIRKWLKIPILLLGFLAVSFSPIADTMKMGQANIFILFLLSYALSRSSGLALGLAAMTKMSPALLFFQWILQKRWKGVLICAASVPILTVITVPLVGISDQLEFYTSILPQFSSGAYNGLTIPINLPGNHSIPDLFNQIWPGDNNHTLSETTRKYAFVTNFLCFGFLLVCSARWREEASQCYLQGAMICMMLIIPVYCYEHHLALLFLPIVIISKGLREERMSNWAYALTGLAYFLAAWPLFILRIVQKKIPSLHWLLQESKFAAIVIIGILCIWAAYRHHQRAERALLNCS